MTTMERDVAAEYRRRGWWSDETVSDAVDRNARRTPQQLAYTSGDSTLTWAQFDAAASALAARLAGSGIRAGDRVAVCLRDGIEIHLAFVAIERLGATIVGLGAKAGAREIAHLLGQSGADVLVTLAQHDRSPATELATALRARGVEVRHLVLGLDGDQVSLQVSGEPEGWLREVPPVPVPAVQLDPDGLYLVNSTSGTTGLPKAVLHSQNRWHYFHTQAVLNGRLQVHEVMLSVVPAPLASGSGPRT